jgi:hypothetical protein
MGKSRLIPSSAAKMYQVFGARTYANARGPKPLYAVSANMSAAGGEPEDGKVVDEEAMEVDEVKDEKMGLYPWMVLGITVLVRVMVQWQRSIFSYAYGFTGTGA